MTDVDPLATQRGHAVDIVAELAADGFAAAQEIARGGFGVVYRCEQRLLERVVAVKVLTADLDDESVERFIAEQHAMGRLSAHPNIVTILQAGATASGRPYLVMPYHRQESLAAHIRRHGAIGWPAALRLGVKIAGALAAAHGVGIVHRDVKPGNILLSDYGEPELTDFGIARSATGFHTAAGVVLGSPAYTAPEVLRGESASVASDLYGLGATLFSAIAGHAAFERREGEDVVAQFVRITDRPVPALAASGAPADFVAAITHAMAAEPGNRPSAATEFADELRRVQQRHGLSVDDAGHVLDAEPVGATGRRVAGQSPRSGARTNISADVTSFVGRGREIREIRATLQKVRLLTLTGIGGVGKTRVARSAATELQRAFRDGVWLTDFGFVQDHRFIAQAIGDSVPGPDTMLSLAEQLGDRNILLVLDNCDKFTTDVGDVAATLLEQCPNVRIVATSRTPLGISAEFVYPIGPFTADGRGNDAVGLFQERARAASGWQYDARQEAELAELCDRLDGLPLAIELAALRTRAMSIRDINNGLVDRFALLQGGPRDMHPRHRSLSALLEWTWEQCDDAQRSLWAQFSVFVGSASMDAVRTICHVDGTVADVVDGLVQQSILNRQQASDTLRFRMLDTIREFGERKLDALGSAVSREQLRARHLTYYAALAARSEREWFGPTQKLTSSTVAGEIANMRAAFDWAVASEQRCGVGAGMAADLWFYWIGCGHLREGRLWSELAWDRVRAHGKPQETRLLWTLGWNLLITGDTDRAEERLRECLAQAGRGDDARAATYATALLAGVSYFRGDVAGALDLYRSSIASARERGDQLATAMFTYHFAEAYCLHGDFGSAEECCRESIAVCERSGDQWCLSYARWVQALAAYRQGYFADAESFARRALTTMATLDDQLGVALIGELLAWVAVGTGDFVTAATLSGATKSYWSAIGCAVMGIPQLNDIRDACAERVAVALPGTRLESATARGEALGLDGIATFAGAVAAEPEPVERVEPTPRMSADSGVLQQLTLREREIADLVALGLTNREIATRLIIGKRTVDTHVAHILKKCGLGRRAEIAVLCSTAARAR